jgi:methionyl aminopeptidase
MVEYKTSGEIDAMHAAGQVVARILAAVRAQAAPGVRLAELDATARDVLAEAGAASPFLGYQPMFARSPFPAAICASVNDAALHDIPGPYRLADGDLLSIDCGATLDGWAADAAISVQVGRHRPADTRLIAAATDALQAGIAAAAPGGRLGDICAAIGAVGRSAGYGICADFGGHGIGHEMHEDPHVPNVGRPGRGPRLIPGLVIAIEPWFLAGGEDAYRTDANGWTIRSTDGSRAAHVEHTVAITEAGPRVLTSPDG